jgi:hypothetical protein
MKNPNADTRIILFEKIKQKIKLYDWENCELLKGLTLSNRMNQEQSNRLYELLGYNPTQRI